MRRITYIEAIESIQGQLGTRQDLRYANSNNKAWYSPVGGRQSARNYNVRFIGMRRTIDGRNYYAVKKKSTFKNTQVTRLSCAYMGATASVVNSILHTLTVMHVWQAAYTAYLNAGGKDSIRKWMTDIVRPQLINKATRIILINGGQQQSLGYNPYSKILNETLSIPSETLSKFAPYLDNTFFNFEINGFFGKAVSWSGLTWKNWVNVARLNHYGFTTQTESGQEYVKLGQYYLCAVEGGAVGAGDEMDFGTYELRESPN